MVECMVRVRVKPFPHPPCSPRLKMRHAFSNTPKKKKRCFLFSHAARTPSPRHASHIPWKIPFRIGYVLKGGNGRLKPQRSTFNVFFSSLVLNLWSCDFWLNVPAHNSSMKFLPPSPTRAPKQFCPILCKITKVKECVFTMFIEKFCCN